MSYIHILITLFLVSAFNTAMFLLSDKWKVIEWYQLNRKTWMPECTFCFFFWAAMIDLHAIVFYHYGTYSIALFLQLFTSSLICAVISRKLL